MSSQRPDDVLNNLFFSVQSAGPVFTGNAQMHPEGEGYRVTLQLIPGAFNNNEVGVQLKTALGRYIRAFLKEQGWRVKSASFKRSHFELVAAPSKASSKESKNL
jgi:hypothetical protein